LCEFCTEFNHIKATLTATALSTTNTTTIQLSSDAQTAKKNSARNFTSKFEKYSKLITH